LFRLDNFEYYNDNLMDLRLKELVRQFQEQTLADTHAAVTGTAASIVDTFSNEGGDGNGEDIGGSGGIPKPALSVYAFSSHFHDKLTERGRTSMCHDLVARWTKNTDIFSKTFSFLVINLNLHW
jgi:hypothetical protein